MIRRSAMVARLPVKEKVAGSSPAAGARKPFFPSVRIINNSK